MDLTTATPVEIDTELARIHAEIYKARALASRYWDSVERATHTYLHLNYRVSVGPQQITDALVEVHEMGEVGDWNARSLRDAFARYEAVNDEVTELVLSTQPYDEEYIRRGTWTRAFLVNNVNGHVHSSRYCSTCFGTTEFCWLPELSDHAESEIVEEAGERACTVCYPTAPVEVLQRKTRLFTPDEKAAQAARVEREAKRAAKAEAAVVVEDYKGWQRRRHTETFKSVRAVTNAIASALGDLAHYGTEHPSGADWETDVALCRVALTAKGVEYDYDKALAAARKKVTREGGTPKY